MRAGRGGRDGVTRLFNFDKLLDNHGSGAVECAAGSWGMGIRVWILKGDLEKLLDNRIINVTYIILNTYLPYF